MKKLLILSALITSSSAFATSNHSLQFNSDECQVEFKNDVMITPEQLQITTAQQSQWTINDSGNVSKDGEVISLTSTQQDAMRDYADSLRVQLPKVANIALEGVKIAGVALNEVSNAFELSSLNSIGVVLDELHIEINDTFYQDGAFVMGKQTFDQFGSNFDQQFEAQIESAVQGAMMESIGSILMAIGSEMTSSNGDMSSFEQRMKDIGQAIEEKVEMQARAIESQADQLCGQFATIAQTEQQLSQTIPEFSGYALFNTKLN
ncbi:hypothetical protein PCIT_a4373 [Pseudoalteromonas citrea]|uniref:DUF2884 domain-containing protein n=2 Tax=Pseudoalteromonas citrea TaxID=43655 RepID=A0AAD4AFT5_9GAMM|nr:DUF2884 family protein [Pseudoalteromonas citrea]KAF7767481.1 hypothetical protein PCIT_a4373 [Pseudoalteromonas citrea]